MNDLQTIIDNQETIISNIEWVAIQGLINSAILLLYIPWVITITNTKK